MAKAFFVRCNSCPETVDITVDLVCRWCGAVQRDVRTLDPLEPTTPKVKPPDAPKAVEPLDERLMYCDLFGFGGMDNKPCEHRTCDGCEWSNRGWWNSGTPMALATKGEG